jgi:hypothetical protein
MSDSRELPVNPRFGTPGVTVLPADGVAIVESGVGVAASGSGPSGCAPHCVWGDDSRILLFGTDGVTDRVTYNHVLCSRQS